VKSERGTETILSFCLDAAMTMPLLRDSRRSTAWSLVFGVVGSGR
jgi:hypothetical protein